MIGRLLKNTRGNVAVMTALILPLLLGFASAGVDFQRLNHNRNSLQELADTLALRGAREFLLANASASQIESVLKAAMGNGLADQFDLDQVSFNVVVNMEETSVAVSLKHPAPNMLLFSHLPSLNSPIGVDSTAAAYGGMKVCVVAIEDSADGAIEAKWSAQLSADECTIISNSSSPSGIDVSGSAKLSAGKICSAGGKRGDASNYDPLPTTDCPVYEDPLSERTPPTVGMCDETDLELGDKSFAVAMAALSDSFAEYAAARYDDDDDDDDDSYTPKQNYTTYDLEPGVFCGGISIASNADVQLAPGVYVIKDGPLNVSMGAHLTGEDVSFYLEGDDAVFNFGPDSKISLEASKNGPLAGILFFEDRNAPIGRKHRIMSDDARVLLGTFYLPRGVLHVSSLLPIADQSAYTVIVSRGLELTGSPTLVLNSDYASSDVPVPAGVGPVGGGVRLRE